MNAFDFFRKLLSRAEKPGSGFCAIALKTLMRISKITNHQNPKTNTTTNRN
jgi:hypothetical protein